MSGPFDEMILWLNDSIIFYNSFDKNLVHDEDGSYLSAIRIIEAAERRNTEAPKHDDDRMSKTLWNPRPPGTPND